MNISITAKIFMYLFHPLLPCPGKKQKFFSVTIDYFSFSRILHKWVWTLSCLGYFTQLNYRDSSMLLCVLMVYCFLLMSSIPFYGYNKNLSKHLLMDIWVVSSLWLLHTKLLWTFTNKCFCGHILWFVLGEHLGVKWLNNMIGYIFSFLGNYHSGCTILHFHQQRMRVLVLPHTHQPLEWVHFINSATLIVMY